MTAPLRAVALTLLFLAPALASANGHRHRTAVASYYYYPAVFSPYAIPVVAVPMPTAPPPLIAVPQPAPPVYATPVPAPALPTPPPGVKETPSLYESTASPLARVSFWNYTGRDVRLRIDGEDRALPAGRCLTLELAREFAWRMDDRAEEIERVPASQGAVEIVLRR